MIEYIASVEYVTMVSDLTIDLVVFVIFMCLCNKGKMHGEGKFIDNNGINLDLKCLHNSCQIINKSISENKKLNSHTFLDSKYKNIQNKKSKYYKENFYALSEFKQKKNQINASLYNLKINNIYPINEIFSINKLILNNKIQHSIQSKQIIPTEKTFKYIK